MKFLAIETATVSRIIGLVEATDREAAEMLAHRKMRGGVRLCCHCTLDWDEGESELILIEKETS